MSEVLLELDHYVRGEMVTKLLAAAEQLGFPVSAIKSQSEGFLVPTEVHAYLFPSMHADPAETTLTTIHSDASTQLDPLIDPAADFADIDDDELDALTRL
jgi:hypothetical protein